LPIVHSMKLELPPIPDAQRTPLVETLLDLLRQVVDRVQQLEETSQQLRDEIARLKGQNPRPQLQPSILQLTTPANDTAPAKPRPGAAGGAVAQQCRGMGHPRVRETTESQRRQAERCGPALPGYVCAFEEDVPQVGAGVLGLASGSGNWPGTSAEAGRADPAACAAGDGQKGRGRACRTDRVRARGQRDSSPTPQRLIFRHSYSAPRGFEKLRFCWRWWPFIIPAAAPRWSRRRPACWQRFPDFFQIFSGISARKWSLA